MKKSLKALQAANLPRLSWEDILKFAILKEPIEVDLETLASSTVSVRDAILEYFAWFTSVEDGKCVRCSTKLWIHWGLVHGEANCGECGYPMRVYHSDIGPVKFRPTVLQYHPDELKTKRSRG